MELLTIKSPFNKNLPKQAIAIANHILQHCLIYFISESCPIVEVIDGSERINLNEI